MDINIDQDIHTFQTEITPSAIVSKIKFDPNEKALKGVTDDVTFFKGDIYVYESSAFESVLDNSATSSTQLDVLSANAIASEYETSITKHRKIWESLPSLEDYFELDTLNNVEEAESAFYKASEKYSW